MFLQTHAASFISKRNSDMIMLQFNIILRCKIDLCVCILDFGVYEWVLFSYFQYMNEYGFNAEVIYEWRGIPTPASPPYSILS